MSASKKVRLPPPARGRSMKGDLGMRRKMTERRVLDTCGKAKWNMEKNAEELCTNPASADLHTCPYEVEIRGSEATCTCCESCRRNCALEV